MYKKGTKRLSSALHAFCVGVVIGTATFSLIASAAGSSNLTTTMLVGLGTGVGVAAWSALCDPDF